MKGRLLVILVLTNWAQVRGDEKPLPDPPGRTVVVGISVMNGRVREVRQLTIIIPAPPAPANEDDEPRLARPVGPINLNTAVVERENFDRWLFTNEPSEAARRKHLEDALRAQIDLAALHYNLTTPQRAKLRLAGRGDIKRFFDQVEERRVSSSLSGRVTGPVVRRCFDWPRSRGSIGKAPSATARSSPRRSIGSNDDRKAGMARGGRHIQGGFLLT
jgi:hypothetical protein